MKKEKQSIVMLAVLMFFTAAALFLPVLVHAGDLEPAAPPGPTMHTLEDIYNIVSGQGGQCEAAVPKTGQTTSYATGDDGALQKGAAWPNPRFTDNNNGTVTDNLTGLIWLKNANRFGTKTWADALTACNTLAVDGVNLTDDSQAGDWRLPNLRELQSLIDYGRYNPALPAGHPFTGVQSFYHYWSATTLAGSTVVVGSAWGVHLVYGGVDLSLGDESGNRASDGYVWPVRGGQ